MTAVDLPSDYELSRFQVDVLFAIAGYHFDALTETKPNGTGQPHGVAIQDMLAQIYDDVEIHHGRLYPNLDKLVEHGLVTKDKKNERTNVYGLTDEGRSFLQERSRWAASAIGFHAVDPAYFVDDVPDIKRTFVWGSE